jgi:spoIIIJ-associated protein
MGEPEESEAGKATAWPDDPAERVRAILERILDELDMEGNVEISETEDLISARIEGPELGLLIGRRGQTIDAIQLLCFQAAFRGLRERKRVTVDAAGYRDRRRETIERRADRVVEEALRTNGPVELEAMSAQERRVVHDYLKERAGVETYSEGDEPNRFVVVAPLVSDPS